MLLVNLKCAHIRWIRYSSEIFSNIPYFSKITLPFLFLQVKIISKEQFLAANKNLTDGKNHDSRFIKTMSELEWTKSEMEKRTAKKSKNCNTLPMCTPEKVDYLKSE